MIFVDFDFQQALETDSIGEVGDAMVRELDMSRITLRLVERASKESEKDDDHVLAKLTGQTIDILRKALVSSF